MLEKYLDIHGKEDTRILKHAFLNSYWCIFMVRDVAHFQTIWFTYSIVSNLIGMHIIRTAKVPFVQSNAHKAVYISSILLMLVGILVPFTPLGNAIGLVPIAGQYYSTNIWSNVLILYNCNFG